MKFKQDEIDDKNDNKTKHKIIEQEQHYYIVIEIKNSTILKKYICKYI